MRYPQNLYAIISQNFLIDSLEFTKQEIILACKETISNLNLDDKKFFICPFITPSNLLYTDNKQYRKYFWLLTPPRKKRKKKFF